MRQMTSCLFATASFAAVTACSSTPRNQTEVSRATVFEGARLITGDGSQPIDDSAFIVENGRVSQVGQRGALKVPAGASRVDLTGKSVMPAIVAVSPRECRSRAPSVCAAAEGPPFRKWGTALASTGSSRSTRLTTLDFTRIPPGKICPAYG